MVMSVYGETYMNNTSAIMSLSVYSEMYMDICYRDNDFFLSVLRFT